MKKFNKNLFIRYLEEAVMAILFLLIAVSVVIGVVVLLCMSLYSHPVITLIVSIILIIVLVSYFSSFEEVNEK